MRQETISINGVTAVIRTRSRRTAITEAQYAKAIRDVHPEIDEYVQATAQVMRPGLPIDANGNVKAATTPEENAAIENFMRQVTLVELQHAIGKAYGEAMNAVTPLLARIVTVGGTVFHVNGDGNIPNEGVVAALEDWLNDDGEEAGFWSALSDGIQRLDAPLTPVSQQPPETLTPEQQDSPLSESLENAGSSG